MKVVIILYLIGIENMIVGPYEVSQCKQGIYQISRRTLKIFKIVTYWSQWIYVFSNNNPFVIERTFMVCVFDFFN